MRRRLLSVFKTRPLATEMEEVELIQRAWPVAEISTPYRTFGRILDDIYQHTVRNYDWDNDELLIQLGFLTCSQAQAFLISELNGHLQDAGFRLALIAKLSGSPVYKFQKAILGSPADQRISAALRAFDPDDVHAR